MEEYFVGTEGGELSFMESSDGNILLDQGQNITQPQATNVVYGPTTQLYFVQGSESVPSQQSIVGGETQTLYGAPVQQENVSMEIAKQSIPQTITLPARNDVRAIQSHVGDIQHISVPVSKPVQRKVAVRQTPDSTQGLSGSKRQTMQVAQSPLCVASTSQNGQLVDLQHEQRVVGQLPQAALQQLLRQSGKFIITSSKNVQGLTQVKVQQDPKLRTVPAIAQMRQPVATHAQKSHTAIKVHQNTLAHQQLGASIPGQQNSTAYQVQQYPIAGQIQHSSPTIQIQQASPAIQIQQNNAGYQVHRPAANPLPSVKIDYPSSRVQMRTQPNLNVQRSEYLVRQNIANQLKQIPSNTLSISNTTAAQSYLLGKQQSQLSNTSGGYVVQTNKRVPGQSITIANATIVFQCRGCKALVDKPGKCPKCGGEQFSKVLATSTAKPAPGKADGNISAGPALTATRTPSQSELINQRSDAYNMCPKCSKLSQNKFKCEHCNQNFFSSRYKTVTSSNAISSNVSISRTPNLAVADSSANANKPNSQNITVNTCLCGHIKEKSLICQKCGRTDQSLEPSNSAGNEALKESIVLETQTKTVLEEKKQGAVKVKAAPRSKGRAKAKGRVPEEPVILTLSSDDDSEEKKELKKDPAKSSALPVQLHPKEPIIKSEPTVPLDGSLFRLVTQPLNLNTGVTYAALQCRNIRIGSYRTIPTKKVIFSNGGITIVVSPITRGNPPVSILIPTDRIFKILVHFGASLPVFFLYVKPQLAACIRHVLGLNDPTKEYFDPCSKDECLKRITILSEKMNEEAKQLMKLFYRTPHRVTNAGATVPMLEEIAQLEAHNIFRLSSIEKSKSSSMKNNSLESKSLLVFPPKHKGAVTITIDDYNCLEEEQFLNDVIIDFYLKWLVTSDPSDSVRSRTHVFSTFFYKRLTAKPSKARRLESHESDPSLTAAQRRHARVKSWTKGVDIFQKDFIIVPINEHSHWFLAMICFPGLNGVITQPDDKKSKQKQSKNKRRKTDPDVQAPIANGEWSDRDEASGDEEEALAFEEEEEEGQKVQKQTNAKAPIKQPCILIFDSLRGSNRVRVLATLREYLTVEYRQRRGVEKIFSKDTMKGCVPMVPQQNNLSDCGLYTLHFAESFFEKPILSYKLPIKSLSDWFPQEDVCKKREDIAKLIKSLMDEYRPNHGITLPALFQHNGSEVGSPLKVALHSVGDEADQRAFDQLTQLAATRTSTEAFTTASYQPTGNNVVANLKPVSGSILTAPPSATVVVSSPVCKMQPEMIRDSETSEVLLIVNPTRDPPAKPAADVEPPVGVSDADIYGTGTGNLLITQNFQSAHNSVSDLDMRAVLSSPNLQLTPSTTVMSGPSLQAVPNATASTMPIIVGSNTQMALNSVAVRPGGSDHNMQLARDTSINSAVPDPDTQSFRSTVIGNRGPFRTYSGPSQSHSVSNIGNISTPVSSTQPLLKLAEIAASRERNTNNVTSSSPWTSVTTPNCLALPPNYAISGRDSFAPGSSGNTFGLPSMNAMLSRGISSAGSATVVSSHASKGLLSSSRVADMSDAENRVQSSVLQMQIGQAFDPTALGSMPIADMDASNLLATTGSLNQPADNDTSPTLAGIIHSSLSQEMPSPVNVQFGVPSSDLILSSSLAKDIHSSIPTRTSCPLSVNTAGRPLLAYATSSPQPSNNSGNVNPPATDPYGSPPASLFEDVPITCPPVSPTANVIYHNMQPAMATQSEQALDFEHITSPAFAIDNPLPTVEMPLLTSSACDSPSIRAVSNVQTTIAATISPQTPAAPSTLSKYEYTPNSDTPISDSYLTHPLVTTSLQSSPTLMDIISPSINTTTPGAPPITPCSPTQMSDCQRPQLQAMEISGGEGRPSSKEASPCISARSSPAIRLNTRCGRTIAVPKRYLDSAELPNLKKRPKSKKG